MPGRAARSRPSPACADAPRALRPAVAPPASPDAQPPPPTPGPPRLFRQLRPRRLSPVVELDLAIRHPRSRPSEAVYGYRACSTVLLDEILGRGTLRAPGLAPELMTFDHLAAAGDPGLDLVRSRSGGRRPGQTCRLRVGKSALEVKPNSPTRAILFLTERFHGSAEGARV